jgi:hypothetical protein
MRTRTLLLAVLLSALALAFALTLIGLADAPFGAYRASGLPE